MRRFFGVMVVLFAMSTVVWGQAASEIEPADAAREDAAEEAQAEAEPANEQRPIEDDSKEPKPLQEQEIRQLFIEALRKKSQALREIDQSPDRVAGEVSRVMASLDSLFQNQIQERLNTHYEEVEQALQNVSLPQDTGNLELYLEQLKEGLKWLKKFIPGTDPSELEESYFGKLVEDFVRSAMTEIEPLREELAAYIDDQVKETQADLLQQAQTTIRAPFQGILARYFPEWDVPHLIPPPLPPLPAPPLPEGDPAPVPPGLLGLLLLLLRRRIARMVTTKIAGKVLGKLIPFVGALLLLIDVLDAAQAKVQLEQTLREQFLITYQEEFSSTAIWDEPIKEGDSSTREQIEQRIADHLNRWAEHCRGEVEAMLEATQVFVISPNVQDYIAEQTQRGADTRDIVEDMSLVGGVFGPEFISLAPLDVLLMMIVHAPDKQELARLARELGAWLLQEYIQHGKEVLITANRLGVSTFLEVVRAGKKLDWYDVRELSEQYPRDMSELARRGLVLALLEQVAESGVTQTTLENIARHEKLFRFVAPLVVPDTDKLFELFGNPPAIDVVNRAYQRNPEAVEAFLSQWPVRVWERYQDATRLNALLAVADYRLTERGQDVDEFAREIDERDELTPIFIDVGRCGVQLWDAYVGPDAGQHQRGVVKNAIYLFKEGYPCDVLQTEEGLSWARFFQRFSYVGGLQAFHWLRPVGKMGSISVLAVPILVLTFLAALLCWRIAARVIPGKAAAVAAKSTENRRQRQ